MSFAGTLPAQAAKKFSHDVTVFSVVDRISGRFHTLLLEMPAYYPDCEIITRKMRLFNRKIAKNTQRYPATPKNSFGHALMPHNP